MSEMSLGEDLPMGAEDESSVQERLSEMKRKAGQNARTKRHMKKQEGNVRKKEKNIITFLIQCISNQYTTDSILEALNNALADGHSPYLIIAILSLLYNIDLDSNFENSKTLSIRDDVVSLQEWLNRIETASQYNGQKTYQILIGKTDSIRKLIESILQEYRHIFPQAQVSADLVELSHTIVKKLKMIIVKYIQSHSLE